MIKETIDALTLIHPVKKFHNLFILDKISEKKKVNIGKTYGAEIDSQEEILLVQDDTVFGKADNGFSLTEKAIYYNLSDPKGGFKRQQGKITMEFILDSALGKLQIENKYLTFNGIRFGKITLLDLIEITFVNELFDSFYNLKQDGKEKKVKGKGKEAKIASKGKSNISKIPPNSKFIYFENGDQYFGEVVGEKINGFGIYYYNSSDYWVRYEGTLKDGKHHGQGSLSYKNGERYYGEFKDDKRFGKGIFNWPDGANYEGAWLYDQRSGIGIHTCSDGRKYSGEWKNDEKHGNGIFTWTDGANYEGAWLDDQQSGVGIFTCSDGRKYTGEWKNNKKHGNGTFTWTDGAKYEGTWLDDQRSGTGIHTFSDGSKYSGEWKNGLWNGKGIYILPDGGKYEGEWKEQKMHGAGTLFDEKGTIIYQGQWYEDIFVGAYKGTLTDENGIYTGQIDNQKKNGNGIMNYSKRNDGLVKFEGEWKNDKTAKGTYFFNGGTTITGTFSNDYTTGKGIITQNDGVTFEGSWENLQLPKVTGNDVRLLMIPEINKIILAQEYVNDDFRGKFIFETQQIGNTLEVKSIDDELDNLMKDEQCDKILKIIEDVRNKIGQQDEIDDKIHAHLKLREEAIKTRKNEILHRSILAKFGVSDKPEPEIKQEKKPKDDFDDFA